MLKKVTVILFLMTSLPSFTYGFNKFDSSYYDLIASLNCVACQNQSLINSNTSSAISLRQVVKERLAEGRSLTDVKKNLARKYGREILSSPGTKGIDIMFWLIPSAILLIIIFNLVRRDSVSYNNS